MPETPNYSFHSKPRFSANHLAEYLCTQTPNQRAAVIRSAKFPRKPTVIPYSKSRRIIRDFLSSNTGNFSHFDQDLSMLATELARETEGWTRDELRRNINAIEEFKKAFTATRSKRHTFTLGPQDMTMPIANVRVSVRLDAGVSEHVKKTDTIYFGGCILTFASTETSRKNFDERCKIVAAIIHWAMQTQNPNVETLERICMSYDVFGNCITKAPKAIDRLRSNMSDACAEAAARWDEIEPPAGYDGPPWR